MAYITQSQLASRFASLQFWTDDALAGSVDTAIVNQCIADAEGKINEAAGQVYATPLELTDATTAAVVRTHCAALAGYYLCGRVNPDNIPEFIKTLFEDALEWLKQLRAGRVYLPGEATATVSRPSGEPVMRGDERVVTRESMEGL